MSKQDTRRILAAHRAAVAEGRAVRMFHGPNEVSVTTYPTVEAARQAVEVAQGLGIEAFRIQVTLQQQATDLGLPADAFLKS